MYGRPRLTLNCTVCFYINIWHELHKAPLPPHSSFFINNKTAESGRNFIHLAIIFPMCFWLELFIFKILRTMSICSNKIRSDFYLILSKCHLPNPGRFCQIFIFEKLGYHTCSHAKHTRLCLSVVRVYFNTERCARFYLMRLVAVVVNAFRS